MSMGLMRIGICDIQDLRDRLIYLLKADPDCPDLFPFHTLDCVEEMQVAFEWLDSVSPDPRVSLGRESGWFDSIDEFFCKHWGELTHRERAIVYIMAHDQDE
jgi:hypothetical protein